MNTAAVAEVSPDGAVELEAVFARIIEQIDEVREQMKADDAAIVQLKAERDVLKAEAQTLRDETRVILANIQRIS